jgi:hypothetical protein
VQRAYLLESCGLEVTVPQVEGDGLTRFGGVSPKLTSLETDAIERLRLLAKPMRVRIGKGVRSVEPDDRTPFAARVSR